MRHVSLVIGPHHHPINHAFTSQHLIQHIHFKILINYTSFQKVGVRHARMKGIIQRKEINFFLSYYKKRKKEEDVIIVDVSIMASTLERRPSNQLL